MKRLSALLLVLLCLSAFPARADLPWPEEPTEGQEALARYVAAVNENLLALGEKPVNSLFECWPALAVLGITAQDNAEAPEAEGDLQFTVYLSADSPDRLEIEMTESPEKRADGTVIARRIPERFPAVCTALIRAAAPESMSLEDAADVAEACMARIRRDPDRSFSDEVLTAKGESPRVYFDYQIDAYGELGAVSLRMTLIFPLPGSGLPVQATPVPPAYTDPDPVNDDGNPGWEGYFPDLDDASHYEIFVTPTPEPDSAVYNP